MALFGALCNTEDAMGVVGRCCSTVEVVVGGVDSK